MIKFFQSVSEKSHKSLIIGYGEHSSVMSTALLRKVIKKPKLFLFINMS